MAQDVNELFSDSDRARIEEAVRSAEEQTSGEIVAYVVNRSDDYETAEWRSALYGALLVSLLVALWRSLIETWGVPTWWWLALAPLAGAALGYLVVLVSPAVRRSVAGNTECEMRVGRRAERAFLEEEVFNTRDRTGILLFLSLMERRVTVLADRGINSVVEQWEWNGIVDDAAAGIRGGDAVEALIEAIRRCGELLAERGVKIRPDDSDELSNRLRMERE